MRLLRSRDLVENNPFLSVFPWGSREVTGHKIAVKFDIVPI